MPVLGLLHILIAIYFAVHAVRNGQQLYWIAILFMFPAIGSAVYFFAIYLPQSRLDSSLRMAGNALQKAMDPGRELREARTAFDLTPTAHNQMRLAAALSAAGMTEEAVKQFDACLAGPFAKDPEIGIGAAQAKLAAGNPHAAITLLQGVAANHATFRPEQVGLMLAKAFAAAGRQDEAGAQFAALAQRFGSIESYGEQALWALGRGERAMADHALKELAHLRKHSTRHTLNLHQDLLRRIDAATGGRS